MMSRSIKPLGHKAYGSIPHLPGSRRGPADLGLSVQQSSILTDRARDKEDIIVVQEKLDGSCVSVANIEGRIVPLIRAGYPAELSHWSQHHYFHRWAMERAEIFRDLLQPGERCVGEWLMEAHGTRYLLMHGPFVVFDIMREYERETETAVTKRLKAVGLPGPRLIHKGAPISIASVLEILEPSGHGALDPVEGAVWRVERRGKVDFLGKYVRPEKVDGCYLAEVTKQKPVYNWEPNSTERTA